MQLEVLQAVTLGWGTGEFNSYLGAGLRVHRFAPIGIPTGVPSMSHSGDGFFIPVRFRRL